MSQNWVQDIFDMHVQYDFHPKIIKMLFENPEMLKALLEFRIKFLDEELTEIKDAKSAEDVVDGLIDLCVVAIGTLDLFGVDAEEAWDRVHAANMSKRVGVKESRPNPLGLPDLIKPEGWQAPDHKGNTALLSVVFRETVSD